MNEVEGLAPIYTLYSDYSAPGVTMVIQEYGDVDFRDDNTGQVIFMTGAQFSKFVELHREWVSEA